MTRIHSQDFRSGFVSIIGRPNVGKSTLLNAIVGQKIAIVSKIPQTTRSQIRGIYNSSQGQVVFIDTPGLVRGKDKLDELMKQSSFGTIEDVDCVIHLVDANKTLGEEEQMIIDKIKNSKKPLILGLNKIDLKGTCVPEYIEYYKEQLENKFNDPKRFVLLPLSGARSTNIEKLIELIFERLPTGPALYPQDAVSDVPEKNMIADIVREKFLQLMRDEIPYALAVQVDQIQRRRNKLTYVAIEVFVEHSSQKEIVIGKKGHILKDVGVAARQEIESLLDRRIFLEIHVKVKEKWRDNISILKDLGYV
ncbi:MAG TPA: GTPase Era [Candidatus Omnitrophota bacterium]|nr:GTPase Era [Candidatus Omnitrophota bacterium]